jgi:hypothetical protein
MRCALSLISAKTLRVTAFALVVIALSGCGLFRPSTQQPDGFPFARMAPTAPPEPVAEERQVPDDPTIEIWRAGFWYYNGFDFTWVPGALVPRPDQTAMWQPDRWELRDYGWAFIPGYWQ